MIVRGRGPIATAGRGRPIPTMDRGYPLGVCRLCHLRQPAGYCTRCGASVDPLDKDIRWPPEKSWLPSEADE